MSIPTIFDSNNTITLVNLYSKDNALFEIGNECYFLTFNLIDFHIPILCKGVVIYDRFNEEINKTYFIQLTEILDDEKVLEKHLYGKQITTYAFNHEKDILSTRSRLMRFEKNVDFSYFHENLIKIDCFFVRKDLEKIKKLRSEYIEIIVSDLQKQILETEVFKH